MRPSYFTQRAFQFQTAALFHEDFTMQFIATRPSNFFPLPSFITGIS
jgi:hypothetical protein